MIKKIAWEAFKNTGDINTYLELKQIENLEDKIENQLGENIKYKMDDKIEKNEFDNMKENVEGKEGL